MIKLSNQTLSGRVTEPVDNILKIFYVPNDKIYFLFCDDVLYELSKQGNYLIWTIPENIKKKDFRIKIQAVDKITKKMIYVTNEINIRLLPLAKSVENIVSTDTLSLLSSPMEMTTTVYNQDYPVVNMVDEHPPIPIDKNKRTITMPTNYVVAVARDNNSQILTFEIASKYDGIPFYGKVCGIHFINAEGAGDQAYPVNVHTDGNKLVFGWLLDNNVAAKEGSVSFKVVFLDYDDNGKPYIWQTKPAKFQIEGTIFVDTTIIEEKYPTLIEGMQLKLMALEELINNLESGGTGEIPSGFLERFDTVESTVSLLNSDVTQIKGDVSQLGDSVTQLRDDFEEMEDDIEKGFSMDFGSF